MASSVDTKSHLSHCKVSLVELLAPFGFSVVASEAIQAHDRVLSLPKSMCLTGDDEDTASWPPVYAAATRLLLEPVILTPEQAHVWIQRGDVPVSSSQSNASSTASQSNASSTGAMLQSKQGRKRPRQTEDSSEHDRHGASTIEAMQCLKQPFRAVGSDEQLVVHPCSTRMNNVHYVMADAADPVDLTAQEKLASPGKRHGSARSAGAAGGSSARTLAQGSPQGQKSLTSFFQPSKHPPADHSKVGARPAAGSKRAKLKAGTELEETIFIE